MKERVYFTPSPEDIGSIAQRLLFSDELYSIPIPFVTSTVDEGGSPTGLTEHILFAREVCTTTEGFTITGELESVEDVVGRISVNTTVDPPEATFEQISAV